MTDPKVHLHYTLNGELWHSNACWCAHKKGGKWNVEFDGKGKYYWMDGTPGPFNERES